MRRGAKRALIVVAVLVIAIAGIVWFVAHDEVRALRAMAAQAQPVPRLIADAIVAAEGPAHAAQPSADAVLRSARALLPSSPRLAQCAPTLAYTLVRNLAPPRGALRWHFENAVSTFVVTQLFTPDEILRIYAHDAYLGRNDRAQIRGFESASRFYFAKEARDLDAAEAATLAGMLRNPHHYSPRKDAARATKRRDFVLDAMLRSGAISEHEYRSAIATPVTAD
jgi:membrane peptidoglycan carboxypeptidase